jgi:prevent-host-death family protein
MEVGVAQAKDRLSELIDRAVAGEVVTITRHGRPLVTLNSAHRPPTREEAEQIFRELESFRAQMPRLTDDDVVALINEGRRY